MKAFPNPRPVAKQPRFYESSELRVERDSDALARQWLKNRTHGRQNEAVLQNVRQLQWQLDHLRFRKGGGEGEAGLGFKWAKPKAYDPLKSYKKNVWTVVEQDSPAYTVGVSTDATATVGEIVGVDGFGPKEDRCLPGIYCCVKSPKVLATDQPDDPDDPRNYEVHVPNWPHPDAFDVDGTNNYWILISLIPITLNVCINGEYVPHYVHAQPVEAVLGGEGGEAMVGEGGEGLGAEA